MWWQVAPQQWPQISPAAGAWPAPHTGLQGHSGGQALPSSKESEVESLAPAA